MRADMAKVIVERPRKKGGSFHKPKGYQRRLRRFGEEGPPCREGIKARWQNQTKSLNEHLGPLRRYLDKQVGRPWDKVFSEICAHIDRSSAVQDHVRDHVEAYVTTHVLLIDGVPCNGEGSSSYGKPLHQFRYRPWYVCPRTGRPARSCGNTPSRCAGGGRPMAPELVLFVGLQGAGKSSFYRDRFAGTHDWVSKDRFPNNRNSARRQRQLVEGALASGRSV